MRTYSTLAIAGLAPFLMVLMLQTVGVRSIPPVGSLDAVIASYGLGIVCFIAGSHWATHLYQEPSLPVNLFIASNVIFLAVWLAFVLADTQQALVVQLIALLGLLVIDFMLLRADLLSRHYFRIRTIATGVASLSLLAMIVSP